jgi:glucose-6-phosphate dehydrogenase assembly protein OpcA
MATPLKNVENDADRAWRASAAGTIDADLAALWREIARRAPLSRAVMANLVVFCRRAAGDDVDLTSPPEGVPIDEVARHHPARIILLHHDPEPHAPREHSAGSPPAVAAPGISLAAHVGVLTFGPGDARYGVERIVIRSACSEAALPSIVRPLILGDVPTTVWWTEDLSETHPLAPLVTMGRQLLYDSRQWRDVRLGILALAPLLTLPFGPDLADVNWRRLLPLRQALVHAVGSCDTSKRQRLTPVHIRHRPGEGALAWLMAGWLQQAGLEDVWEQITVDEDSRLGDDVLTVVFDDGLHLRLDAHRVSVEDPLGPAPFAVPVRRETDGEAVAAELRVLTHDVSLHRALAAVAERLGKA